MNTRHRVLVTREMQQSPLPDRLTIQTITALGEMLHLQEVSEGYTLVLNLVVDVPASTVLAILDRAEVDYSMLEHEAYNPVSDALPMLVPQISLMELQAEIVAVKPGVFELPDLGAEARVFE